MGEAIATGKLPIVLVDGYSLAKIVTKSGMAIK